MTKHPIQMYDYGTGDVVTFYPSVRTFCTNHEQCAERIFPQDACYIFSPEAKDKIRRFEQNGSRIAIVYDMGIGRNGAQIVTLIDTDYKEKIVYRRDGFNRSYA